MIILSATGFCAIVPDMNYTEVDMSNKFRLEDVGMVRGIKWYTVWADGDVLDWILAYDPKEWVNYHLHQVTITEGMLTILKLTHGDKEIKNPYLGLIPTGNLFYSCGPEGDAYRKHEFEIQQAKLEVIRKVGY